jgi:hypothetical protein
MRSTICLVLVILFAGTTFAEPKPAEPPDIVSMTNALRTTKGPDRATLSEKLILAHMQYAGKLEERSDFAGSVDSLRKARGLTANLPGVRGRELASQVDVRMTLALWRQSTQGRGLHAQYFKGTDFDESIGERIDPNIDFLWNIANPVEGYDGDAFTARWTGFIVAPHPGDYNIIALFDDRCRVWIDDIPVIDEWKHDGTQASGIVRFTGKPQAIKVEFLDSGNGARMSLHWALVDSKLESVIPPDAFFTDEHVAARMAGTPILPPKGFGLSAEYFQGDFARRVFTRVDRDIDFLWDSAYPEGIGEQFSVRWQGFLRAPKAGNYRLTICHDDGIRISIDGKKILNDWVNFKVDEAIVHLTGAPQPILIEYRNRGGGASLSLLWQVVDAEGNPTLIPPSAFFNNLKTAENAP